MGDAAQDSAGKIGLELTVIILARDEQVHIARAIASVASIANQIIVVDSGSQDRTVEIAREAGARVLSHRWVNYATQFNWALAHLPTTTGWVLRLDADEVITPELADEIKRVLPQMPADIDGLLISRHMRFLSHPIRHGGVLPALMLRLFRVGRGVCEDRFMDEHIIVAGKIARLSGALIDDNRKPLSWWIEKHNHYASREVIDQLNDEYGFLPPPAHPMLDGSQPAGRKRLLKDHLYRRMPPGLRALAYFLYRYIIRFGFLDGWQGTAFHVLQGFWYRYLVDTKLREVRAHMQRNQTGPIQAIEELFGFAIAPPQPPSRSASMAMSTEPGGTEKRTNWANPSSMIETDPFGAGRSRTPSANTAHTLQP